MWRLAVLFVCLQAPVVYADSETKEGPELTKEGRLKRADLMDKMADCLRSDKPLAECREMMRKECPMAKEGFCPMAEEMGMMRGYGHRQGKRRMMREENSEKKN